MAVRNLNHRARRGGGFLSVAFGRFCLGDRRRQVAS